MPTAWAGILCWQVVRKAGIFLLPPPHTHISHLRLHSVCFQPELLAQAFSLPGKSISGAQSVLLGQTHSPGMHEPATQHLGSLMCCHLVGGRALPGDGQHCCCGDAGCSAAPNWAVKHCRDAECTSAPLLRSKTLQGCQDVRDVLWLLS